MFPMTPSFASLFQTKSPQTSSPSRANVMMNKMPAPKKAAQESPKPAFPDPVDGYKPSAESSQPAPMNRAKMLQRLNEQKEKVLKYPPLGETPEERAKRNDKMMKLIQG